jgi:hypothetical protein
MLLVRSTSKGQVALDFQGGHPRFGFNVSVGVFDDAGWMEEKVRWGPWDDKGERVPEKEVHSSLAEAITAGAGLPEAEAQEFANNALKQWRERGGEQEGHRDTIKGLGLVTAIGSGVLLTLVAIVTVAVFVVMLLTNAI